MRVTKNTIHLSTEEINELLLGKEVKNQHGSIEMYKLNFLDPVTLEIFHLGVTKDKLIMLRETGSAQHTYHELKLETK